MPNERDAQKEIRFMGPSSADLASLAGRPRCRSGGGGGGVAHRVKATLDNERALGGPSAGANGWGVLHKSEMLLLLCKLVAVSRDQRSTVGY